MKIREKLVIVRGGGDIATGAIQKIYRAGFNVVVLECAKPTSIRRKVCLSEAVYDGKALVEDLEAIKADSLEEVNEILKDGKIPVVIDEKAKLIEELKPICVVDAILAKKNLGTIKDMAPITIALGPGFEVGKDVDVVVETMRGHNLGRLIFNGEAMKNTGTPGEIKGVSKERVIYSENEGVLHNIASIGDLVSKGQALATIQDKAVVATIDGVLRGLIRDGFKVSKGLKIADIDPRESEKNNCYTISDKARNIGGATLEALLYMINKKKLL